MKSLFDNNECYNEDGKSVSERVCTLLKPLISELADDGFPTRDIESVMINDVIYLAAIERLRRSRKAVINEQKQKPE